MHQPNTHCLSRSNAKLVTPANLLKSGVAHSCCSHWRCRTGQPSLARLVSTLALACALWRNADSSCRRTPTSANMRTDAYRWYTRSVIILDGPPCVGLVQPFHGLTGGRPDLCHGPDLCHDRHLCGRQPPLSLMCHIQASDCSSYWQHE